MPERRLISVIMPVFNAAPTVRRSIASVLRQTYSQFELILVDDGSTDHSPAILRELALSDRRLRLLQPGRREGAARARNRALRAARGSYIAFLDADDQWAAACLEKLRRALHADPSAAQAYCGWQNIGLEPQRCQPYIPPDYEAEDKLSLFLESCPFPIHAVLTRTEAIRQAGGFDERLSCCMDYDLWLRVSYPRRIVRVPEVLAFYLHHEAPQRISRNRAAVALGELAVRRKFLRAHPEIRARLGPQRLRQITLDALFRSGLEAHWRRDLGTARPIFRALIRSGYGEPEAWRYMLPALLPEAWHRRLLPGPSAMDPRQ